MIRNGHELIIDPWRDSLDRTLHDIMIKDVLLKPCASRELVAKVDLEEKKLYTLVRRPATGSLEILGGIIPAYPKSISVLEYKEDSWMGQNILNGSFLEGSAEYEKLDPKLTEAGL